MFPALWHAGKSFAVFAAQDDTATSVIPSRRAERRTVAGIR
jgi:hypothetical protein